VYAGPGPRRPSIKVAAIGKLFLDLRNRAALAFYCATELPLVVAITTIAIDEGHMRSSTAAGLVGAAMLSTLVFPFVGAALRKGALDEEVEKPGPTGPFPQGRGPAPQPASLRRALQSATRARSSVGERSLHTREVAGSKPAVPILEPAFVGPFLLRHRP
jgi:hypothetical protein